MTRALTLMIQGCSSDAGKSYLVAGLCRLYANRGLKVAPFKAQNMSNNAGVTQDGREMGRAQLLQATAARVAADVRMNPVLIKPEADTRSQVVVMGQTQHELRDIPWLERKRYVWERVQESLHSLCHDFELVVMEGAGSPAEINLRSSDIVNMQVALEVQASVLLAVDIDRGGAFAHLLGTFHCLANNEQALLKGFILNKFRGDKRLLGNGMQWLEARTGVPTVGIVPMLRLPLPEEDAFSLYEHGVRIGKPRIAIVLTPYIANFDEFDPLLYEDEVGVFFARSAQELDGVAAVILPGSKHVAADLAYLREHRFDKKIITLAQAGTPILGICGGYQMLGQALRDPHGIEGGGTHPGLGLLDVSTELAVRKTTRLTTVQGADGSTLSGYEIHHGETYAGASAEAWLADNLGYQQGHVMGAYLHGLFENTSFRHAFLTRLGITPSQHEWHDVVDEALDKLAAHLEAHLDMQAIDHAVEGSRR